MVVDCTSLSQLIDPKASESQEMIIEIIESACRKVKKTDHIIGDKILMNFLYDSETEPVPNLIVLN